MIGVVVAALMLLLLVYVVRLTSVPGRDDRLLTLMLGGYFLRLFLQLFTRDVSLLRGAGGDYITYEYWAVEINRIWSFTGFEYISQEQLSELGPTSLPANLFALVIAVNGGEPTPFGCASVVACLACLAALNAYHLSVEIGSDPRHTFRVIALFLFSPAFLLYTADMYKDGLVIFAASSAIASGMRLARRFSPTHLLIGLLSLLALWYIRFYLVFVCTVPLFVGLAGLRAKSSLRPFLTILLMGALFAVVAASTDILDSVSETANATFAKGTDRRVIEANAGAGSGVTFDDGGTPLGAIGPKLAYQLFAPFPWAGGSAGFHLGKIDTVLWYYFMYRAYKASKLLWRENRVVLLMFLSFIVPTTFMYATSFANVGLSLRQRLIVVVITGILATRSWPAEVSAKDEEPGEDEDQKVPNQVALAGSRPMRGLAENRA